MQMPLKLALAIRGTVAGHRLGGLEGGSIPPFPECGRGVRRQWRCDDRCEGWGGASRRTYAGRWAQREGSGPLTCSCFESADEGKRRVWNGVATKWEGLQRRQRSRSDCKTLVWLGGGGGAEQANLRCRWLSGLFVASVSGLRTVCCHLCCPFSSTDDMGPFAEGARGRLPLLTSFSFLLGKQSGSWGLWDFGEFFGIIFESFLVFLVGLFGVFLIFF